MVLRYSDAVTHLGPSLVLAAVVLIGAACGSGSGVESSTRAPEPASVPASPGARTIGYECAESSGNTILVELRKLHELADIVNGIDLCEFDGGLDEIRVEVPCPQGTRTITVRALDGQVSDQAVMDACDQIS